MHYLITVLVLICCVLPIQVHADDWQPLFNGENLDGWIQRGGKAHYEVEKTRGGIHILGSSVPNTSNSFLCTEKEYGDFILEYEFKVDAELNSGVQIRSESRSDYKNGRVHGYQVEIDASDRGWSGGIYDESRRGWINSLEKNLPARYAFKQDQWNHVRVQAIGHSIRTWMNGVPAADLLDTATLKGFIGLQVHGVGGRTEPLSVRWRNLRIQDLGESQWASLLKPDSLDGWNKLPGGDWKMENGILRGTSPSSESRHGMLLSDKRYGDFTAKVVFRANKGNSGFYFRADRVDSAVSVNGFQAEIDPQNDVGGLYETGGRGWVVQPTVEQVKKYFRPGEWNEMTVSAQGRRVIVHVNGQKSAEITNDRRRTDGHFGLQLHGGMEMDVEFKSVDVLASNTKLPIGELIPPSSGPLFDPGTKVKKIAGDFEFTEGPAMGPDGRIYFTDIPNSRIHAYDPASGELAVFRENSGGANGLMFTGNDALYACEGGNRQLTRQYGDEVNVLADKFDGKRFNSPNDLVLDGKGGVYFTDPRYGNRDDLEMDVEAVYYLPRNGKLRRVIDDLVRPNGIMLSLDNTVLYVVDNGAKSIWAYDVQGDGSLNNGRKWVDMEGGGDGMTIDAHGNLYCAGAGKIWIWNSAGELLHSIKAPEGPANCVFGGPENKVLYITAQTGFYSLQMNVAGGR